MIQIRINFCFVHILEIIIHSLPLSSYYFVCLSMFLTDRSGKTVQTQIRGAVWSGSTLFAIPSSYVGPIRCHFRLVCLNCMASFIPLSLYINYHFLNLNKEQMFYLVSTASVCVLVTLVSFWSGQQSLVLQEKGSILVTSGGRLFIPDCESSWITLLFYLPFRKHAYLNIPKILPPKKWKFSDKARRF